MRYFSCKICSLHLGPPDAIMAADIQDTREMSDPYL